ncbi:hypothetical protein STCU_03773 [Strigomonas culicis]|uniref:protein-histidine N-methyltransferase n=1 Tax=Strigomonas culicis TaxID=28005 RepID=S9W4W1_9TRYP|nr:hypothetical protein STCU_03773 [Strigomonas culicis]|eukprot:EPY30930.1 hypothetical protein STCU_03773 [Strigomonas culicis]
MALRGTEPQMLHLYYQSAPEVASLCHAAADPTSRRVEKRDIIPGLYYGGLKVWSCAPYLAAYLLQHAHTPLAQLLGCGGPAGTQTGNDAGAAMTWQQYLRQEGVAVAELGCGQALPALAALALGARRLLLQDYNAEVLTLCTQPNVGHTYQELLRQRPAACRPLHVQLLSGDWADLARLADNHAPSPSPSQPRPLRCPVILGSDVTFDETACEKLVRLLAQWLQPPPDQRWPPAVALIATKEYYFGTNGGVVELCRCAAAHGLEAAVLHREGGGSPTTPRGRSTRMTPIRG